MNAKIIIEEIETSKINPAPYNPRKISKTALGNLKESIETFGYVEPLIWNKRTENLVSGHQRFELLNRQDKIEVSVVDLDEIQEKALNITLNNVHAQGRFDETVGDLLKEIQMEVPDIGGLGITELLGDYEAYIPDLMPKIAINEIGKDELDRKAEDIEGMYDGNEKTEKLDEIICPYCAKEFYI